MVDYRQRKLKEKCWKLMVLMYSQTIALAYQHLLVLAEENLQSRFIAEPLKMVSCTMFSIVVIPFSFRTIYIYIPIIYIF